jgi:hypothetical protein
MGAGSGAMRFGMRTGSGVGAASMIGAAPGVVGAGIVGCGFPLLIRVGSGVGTTAVFGTVGCTAGGTVTGGVTVKGVPGFPGLPVLPLFVMAG